ncbi:MAG TPA: FtsK/SpoIIIE domain-containing protein [Terrimesophilobacter sp.]|nr:FtsK/SpoIIIE domain-containing protein [Terrimesophilobacter sp.]
MTITALSCPQPPEPPPPHPFPVFASVAPVVASVAIWAVTQSPFALVFALLGPVVAVAGLADARRQGRRRMREERARFEREVVATVHAIDEAHERECAELQRSAPSAAAILAAAHHDPERWRERLDDRVPVTLGVGTVVSAIEFDRPAAAKAGESERAIDELRSRAAALDGAPIVIDARLGIGLCGPVSKTVPAAGALLVQLANALPPDAVGLRAVPTGGPGLGWVRALPHWEGGNAGPRTEGTVPGGFAQLEFRSRSGDGAGLVIAAAGQERGLPRECRVVVQLDGAGRARLIRHPQQRRSEFSPGFVTEREATEFANALAVASRGGRQPGGVQGEPLPSRVEFSALRQPAGGNAPALAACLGIGPAGPVIVDLVSDGPHAVVGGTTGSGKSELLITWILAMATGYGPEEVNFLLVDFKGGAAFAPLRNLPHVVGTVTDLEESTAGRALQSLRAELRYREAFLGESGARSIDELAQDEQGAGSRTLARLVIVIDEFATLTSAFPELHELFADLASRGRSLGVHLVLCTQRPAGSVRDAVLANCTLRISLRVNNRADSIAVIGEPDAAGLPRHPPGRAIVARDDALTPMQLALAVASDAVAVAGRWETRPVRRPWLDPLPTRLGPEDLPPAGSSSGEGSGIAFGLLDQPERQRRAVAVYDPVEQSHLLVVGGRRSGKSGALDAIAAGATGAMWVPGSVEGAWDLVTGLLDSIRSGVPVGGLLLFDDVDILLGRFPPDHRAAFVDALTALHREGPAAGVRVVSSCASAVASLSALCETKLVLRVPDRQEHSIAAGGVAGFDPSLPPGGGTWNGSRVQVVLVPKAARPDSPRTPDLDPSILAGPAETGLAVVASAPAPLAARLGSFGRVTLLAGGAAAAEPAVEGGGKGLILGDPDAWNASWGLLGTLRSRAPVLFHGCSVAEYRALSRQRELPPPITSPQNDAWLLSPDGRVERVRLPAGGDD